MLKTLLVLGGVLAMSTVGLHAQVRPSAVTAARSSVSAARPSAYRGGLGRAGGYGYANHRGGGHYGRYYYLGGLPFFYPYDYYGFGYPYGFGGGYGYGYGYGPYPGNYGDENRPPEGDQAAQGSGASLPEAVQRQLAKRGYYKGSIDGQFGPASKDALARFQRKQGLKETARIDEPTLEALGFTDHR